MSDFMLVSILMLGFFICSIFLYKLRSFEDKETFLWIMPYSILVSIALFCIFSSVALIFFDISQLSKTSFFVLAFIFSIISTFLVNTANEEVKFSDMLLNKGQRINLPSKLKKGESYLIKELHKKRAFSLFSKAIKNNFNGLTITRSNPRHLVKRHELQKAKIVWLTEIKNGKNLSPNDLEEISYTINNYITKHKNSIVLIDGFEYLSDYNSFNKVLHLFQVLKDNISVKKAVLLIYINPRTFEKKELKLLESEFKVI